MMQDLKLSLKESKEVEKRIEIAASLNHIVGRLMFGCGSFRCSVQEGKFSGNCRCDYNRLEKELDKIKKRMRAPIHDNKT